VRFWDEYLKPFQLCLKPAALLQNSRFIAVFVGQNEDSPFFTVPLHPSATWCFWMRNYPHIHPHKPPTHGFGSLSVLLRIHQPAQLPMPVREKPQADCRSDAGQNQKLIPDNQRRQNHQREATGTNRRA